VQVEKEFKEKGPYQSRLTATQLTNGLYFLKAVLGTRSKVVKMCVNKL